MTSQTATQVPPIKLKFSLNSKPGPSTSVPAATPAPVVISRKGKAKAVISDGDHTQGSPSFVMKVLGANPDAVIETSEKPSQDTSSKPVIKLYPPSHRPTTPLRAPFIAKDGAPEAGSSTVRSPSPIAEPGRHTVSTVYPSPRASTPAINPSSSSEAALETTPIPTRPITSTPEASTALRTPKTGRKSTGRAKGSKVNPKTRPSAIPPRLLSTDPSTPRSLPAPSLPDESLAPSEGTVVKAELGAEDDTGPDPISLPLLPSAAQVSTPKDDGEEFDTPVTGKGKGGGRWMRLRRPLRELLGRIMVELRRKDEYALFGDPVDLDNFPDYHDIVGGEDKMMDLGTMQYKIDNRDYITMDQVETDLRTLVTAAQIFNPPGTVPHTSATRLLAHGLKHIERARPLVRTPSPSPDPLSSERERSTFSGPEMTAATDDPPFRRTLPDIPPQVYVPEEMLSFPPNSPHASAVGWNLTGGKRVYMRRHIRGREKFAGKWRHWDLDGSRDVAEMDDPAGIFELSRSDHRVGRRITDWKGLRKDAWWDWDGLGGPNGQSPLPFTNFPRLPTLRSRELGQFEWGVYPEIDAEMTYLANRAAGADEEQVISEHLRPLRPRHGVQPANFINVYDDPLGRTASDWLRDLFTGDVKGEAYLVSVDRFVSGAVESAKHRTDRGNVKAETNPHGLEEYVRKTWHNGVLHSSPRSTIERTLKSLHKSEIDDTHLLSMARNAYHRLALRNLTSPNNPLDIAPLLTEPHDFLFQGVGGRSGVTLGIDWAAEEVARLNAERASRSGKRPPSPNGPRETRSVKKVKRDPEVQSTGSSPLSAPPDSPPSTLSTEAAMRRLRLELVALSKYYPLAALKKMDKADAEKLLPENVRKLMSKAG